MRKNLNLSHLTDEECEKIRNVLQKDFEVRRLEKKRISEAHEELVKEQSRIAVLKEKQHFNDSTCIICLERFGVIFHRKRKCYRCGLNVCSVCCQPRADKKKGFICQVCSKEKAYKMLSNQWFYDSTRDYDKTFASSKVVKSLNKRSPSGLSDTDTDSGYTPSISAAVKKPRSRFYINPKQGENEDIDKKAYQGAGRDEEFTFRVQFNKLLEDLYVALEDEDPDGLTTSFASPSYGEVMLAFKDKVKELLKEFTERLQRTFESSADSPEDAAHKVKQNVCKFIDNFIGGNLDLTSDGAISELFSLSNDSSTNQGSFEDLVAHAVVSKLLENHCEEVSESLLSSSKNNSDSEYVNGNVYSKRQREGHSDLLPNDKDEDREEYFDQLNLDSRVTVDNVKSPTQIIAVSKFQEEANNSNNVSCEENSNNKETHISEDTDEYGDTNTGVDEKDAAAIESNIGSEFQELKDFVKKTSRRPKYESATFDDSRLYEVEEETILKSEDDRDENREEFQSRYLIFDRIHGSGTVLPDISQFGDIDFDSGEVDPDLLSLNLEIIPEETEEESEEDKEKDESIKSKANWIFKGKGFSPYKTMDYTKSKMDWEGTLYKGLPKPEDYRTPKIGNRNVDQLSDFSDLEGSDDEENTFYANTSKELARIAEKHKMSGPPQKLPRGYHSDNSDLNGRLLKQEPVILSDKDRLDDTYNKGSSDHISGPIVESGKPEIKLLEDLIPAEDDDPKFLVAPESVTIQEGEPVKFSCRLAGTGHIDVFWYREGDEIEELEDSADVDISTNGDKHSIIIYNINKTMGGQYMCIAMNEKGKTIQYLVVVVKDNKHELKKPEFLKGLQDVEVTEGQHVKFRVKVKGYPPPRISWYKDGELLKNSMSVRTEKFGNRDYILVIDHASMNDDAEYTVMARNVAGEQKMSAQVIVDPQSDLPVRKQNISSTTTSGVSDSDSDRSMPYRSLIYASNLATVSSAFTPTITSQMQTTSLSKPAELASQQRHSELSINKWERKTHKQMQEVAQKDETPSKTILTTDVLDVLKIADDIIELEKQSSTHSQSQRWNEEMSVSSAKNKTSNEHSVFLTQKTKPDGLVDDMMLQETLDNFLLPNSGLESTAQIQSSIDLALPKIDKHKDLRDQYSRDFVIQETAKNKTSSVLGESLSLQPQEIVKQKSTDERGDSSSQCSSPRQSIDSGVYVSSKWEQPQPIYTVMNASEDDEPESQAKFNSASSIELPSVDKLKAVFTSVDDDEDLGDGSFKRVHSITARNVPKEQMEKLKAASSQSQAVSASSSKSLEVPGSSPQISESPQPNNVSLPTSSEGTSVPVLSSTHSTLKPNAQAKGKSSPMPRVRRSLGLYKEPVLIYPVTDPEYMQRQNAQQQHSAEPKSAAKGDADILLPEVKQQKNLNQVPKAAIKRTTTSPVKPQRSQLVTQKVLLHDASPTNEPLIKTGCISARAAFWERKIIDGGAGNDEEFPELMESSNM